MPKPQFPSYVEREAACLALYAMHSADSAGREHPEPEHPYRGPFQRDRDRVLHSAAFRRLSGKTQVFTGSMGDYHRTRLTHTMEVASIARTVGRALCVNEDLIEALALLHDIGHPPFGHAGEDALDQCLADHGGFSHNQFALTLVRELERPYPPFHGLNLTKEVLDGQIGRALKDRAAGTPLLETQIVDIADSITYDAHDVDDALKLNFLTFDQLKDIPLIADCQARTVERFGRLEGKSRRRALVHELIDCQVGDVVACSRAILDREQFSSAQAAREAGAAIGTGPNMSEQKKQLEAFLYDHVYRHHQVVAGRHLAQKQLGEMFHFLVTQPKRLPQKFQQRSDEIGVHRAAGDYLAGMTDQFFLRQHESLDAG